LSFLQSVATFAFSAKFAVGPDNNLALVLSTLQSAKKSLDINIYQLDHPTIVKAIIDQISSGIIVNLLVEGHPVGGMSPKGKAALSQIRDVMIAQNRASKSTSLNHLFVMTAKNSKDRRYRFDHAKYILIDRREAPRFLRKFSLAAAMRLLGTQGKSGMGYSTQSKRHQRSARRPF
jgi:phosphatidylserine/phosphatidylglycerophosphate/cardiolipin synthase-like enzyme